MKGSLCSTGVLFICTMLSANECRVAIGGPGDPNPAIQNQLPQLDYLGLPPAPLAPYEVVLSQISDFWRDIIVSLDPDFWNNARTYWDEIERIQGLVDANQLYVSFLEDIVLMDVAGNISFDLVLDVLDALDRANVHLATARTKLSNARLLHGSAIHRAVFDADYVSAALFLSSCRTFYVNALFENFKAETDIGDAETLLGIRD